MRSIWRALSLMTTGFYLVTVLPRPDWPIQLFNDSTDTS